MAALSEEVGGFAASERRRRSTSCGPSCGRRRCSAIHLPICQRSWVAFRASSRPIRTRCGDRPFRSASSGRRTTRPSRSRRRSPAGRFRLHKPAARQVLRRCGERAFERDVLLRFARHAARPGARHGFGGAAAGLSRRDDRRRVLLGWWHLFEHADRGRPRRRTAAQLADLLRQRMAAHRLGADDDPAGDGAP